jgi:YggT family protein
LGYFLLAVAKVLGMALNLYMWIVIISALLTWVNPDPYNPVVRTLRGLTEPLFYRIRTWLPFVRIGGFDLSPIVVIFAVVFLDTFLVNNLVALAQRF